MSKEDCSNIELVLKHFIDQLSVFNNSINTRLDKMTESIDDLRSHKSIVLQLEKRTDVLEDRYSSMNEKVSKLVYDSNRRDDIKKSFTNPLLEKAIWSVICIVICAFSFSVGFSYKKIDEKSSYEMNNFINDQKH